ncbi:hypothetical protein H1D32_17830 [Anaerobacillus sp. CMMVII]|uniref:hypothetical protein n=1 Tax=Anaerobacillus sp. CMMVII TaxID=2755588 RepID=UPI0021B846F2|nr:hypothetical protein [Anaerobacillus sp. CMMVII]MCT8139400.1 hypothetical protein [Anaerobacillus sp. CMMVII]
MLIFFRRFSYKKLKRLSIVWLTLALIFLHSLGIGIVLAGGKGQHTAYDLYFNSRNPVISSERLGLLTTMRIDLQRHVMGWSPSLVAEQPFIPEPDLVPVIEESNKDSEKSNEEDKPIVIEYNEMEIDFEQLISEEENEEIIEMHHYFANSTPSEKNEYTGKYEGYNLILITAESFAPYAINEEVTPTLHKLKNQGYHFTNFYTPLWEVSTTDGEYVALTGLLPKSGVWSFTESGYNHLPFVMGNQLKNLGYKRSHITIIHTPITIGMLPTLILGMNTKELETDLTCERYGLHLT